MSRTRTLQISITDFAVPSPRLGSLESEATFGGLPLVGTEIHQEIQMDRLRSGGAYVPEKWITHTFPAEPFKITVSGRMDGFQFGTPARIDEIKSSYHVESLLKRLETEPEHPYLLQLRSYGYIHYKSTAMCPDLTLILVCARTRKITELAVDLDVTAYESWLNRRLKELAEREKMFEGIKAKRRKASDSLAFPFAEPRPGQKELMTEIESRMGKSSRLLLQAPTGLGKTAGVLYPALKESLARGQKTIYVTAKNSQHGVAEDAVERIQDAGCKVKSVTVHAKSKMCLKDEVFCNPNHCEFARDYYDKLRAHGVIESLAKKKRLTETVFKETGRKFEVCPFELQLEVLPRADVVICDYNYVFSPRHISGRLTQNGLAPSTPPNLIVDEAHNLAPRANGYYSSELGLREMSDLADQATYLPETLWQRLKEIRHGLEALFGRLREEGLSARRIDPTSLKFDSLEGASQELIRLYLESDTGLRPKDPVLAFCNRLADFSAATQFFGNEFIFSFSSDDGGRLRITCCDSAKHLSERYVDFANVIAFSATLKPFDFHLRTMGLDPNSTFKAEYHSPFPAEHRKILIIPQVSTKWRDREKNYGKIREAIEKIAAIKPGNYFVFFPSFDFLNRVAALTKPDGFRILKQERDMSRKDIESYLDHLREAYEPTLIFAVQGGVFSEGIDYPGRMIIGAIIVGPALPSFDFEREELRRYFDENGGSGFDYAYTFPAMTRVIQSAGRVIRSASDRGVIILMDQRFTHENYVQAMPSEWLTNGREALLSNQILNDLSEFWRTHEAE